MRSFKEKCDTDFGLVQSSLKQLDVSFNMLNTNVGYFLPNHLSSSKPQEDKRRREKVFFAISFQISQSLEYLYKHYNEIDSQGKYRTVSDFIFGYNEFVSRCKHYLEKGMS